MTAQQRVAYDATIALHDRWSDYDVVLYVLTFAAGLALVAVGFLALFSGFTGWAGIAATAGIAIVNYGLRRRPFMAR